MGFPGISHRDPEMQMLYSTFLDLEKSEISHLLYFEIGGDLFDLDLLLYLNFPQAIIRGF